MASHIRSISGIHHVTAIASDPQTNIDFYCGILGLRLVKLTVNFDDPGSYHLYYGDELGRPGTILTFFAWPGAYRGRIGLPQVSVTSFAVPPGSLSFWQDQLQKNSVKTTSPSERLGEKLLSFIDPDGLQLELVESAGRSTPWNAQSIPPEKAIRGFHSVTLLEEGYERTAGLLTRVMGFTPIGSEQNRFRYQAATSGPASIVDLLCTPAGMPGTLGAGIVHHVAFQAANDSEQTDWHKAISAAGYNISPVMDRCYFHSVYYREPGGILFEIATVNPGFTVDQSAEALGSKLMLPPWMETLRSTIEKALPQVELPPEMKSKKAV